MLDSFQHHKVVLKTLNWQTKQTAPTQNPIQAKKTHPAGGKWKTNDAKTGQEVGLEVRALEASNEDNG